MDSTIFDVRTMLRVKTPQEWQRRQTRVLERQRTQGVKVQELRVADPMVVRIEHNRWLFDCPCGSGVAVHPDWPGARCLGSGCGRVFTNLVIPADRAEIEAQLEARPQHANRNWDPRLEETVETLKAENEAKGITMRGSR